MKEENTFHEFQTELEDLRKFVASLDSDQSHSLIVKGILLNRTEKLYEKILLLEGGETRFSASAGEKAFDQPVREDRSEERFKEPDPAPVSIQECVPESISSSGKPLSPLLAPPLTDITQAIGLNDRFLYTRELFNSNPKLYLETIRKVNESGSLESALQYLQEQFAWNPDSDAVISFLSLVRRRYS